MKTKAMLALLMITAAAGISPASANYFSNPNTNTNLNIGSAPNPTPEDLRALGEARVVERTDIYRAAPQALPEPPAPPPAPMFMAMEQPLPPPAPMQEITKRFMVFFDFDKSELSPEGREVVARAVDNAKKLGPVQIMVTGHTDTVGSRAYNMRLSERRAIAVKNEMVHLGLSADEIRTIGRGFDDPIVPTGPGVREPQNRRAIIDLGNPNVASLEHY